MKPLLGNYREAAFLREWSQIYDRRPFIRGISAVSNNYFGIHVFIRRKQWRKYREPYIAVYNNERSRQDIFHQTNEDDEKQTA